MGSADAVDEVEVREDGIRLGQFLKLAGAAESGVHARALLDDGLVTVDGVAEARRGRQLSRGAVVEVDLPNGVQRYVVA